MKKQRNHSQLQEQEKSLEEKWNETDLSSLPDSEFRKEVIKLLKGLRKVINRNAYYCKKRTRNYKRESRKTRNLLK